MIITVTPNPALDIAIDVAALVRGGVLRADASRIDAGGKGVNVARALAAHAVPVRAVLPLGGPSAALFAAQVSAVLPCRVVPIESSVRANVTLTEPDGTTTKINEPGHSWRVEDAAGVLEAVRAEAAGARWVLGCGSLPPGAPDDLYASLVRLAHDAGARAAVDTSGTALARAVEAGPDLVAPNLDELADVVGWRLPTLGSVRQAAADLVRGGVARVLVSLGVHGALLVGAGELAYARATAAQVRCTVGAGDALLAGYLAAESVGRSSRDCLAVAVAWGTACVGLPGTTMPGPAEVAAVHVDTPGFDPAMPLDGEPWTGPADAQPSR